LPASFASLKVSGLTAHPAKHAISITTHTAVQIILFIIQNILRELMQKS
jgi:hypothetical protein